MTPLHTASVFRLRVKARARLLLAQLPIQCQIDHRTTDRALPLG